ncbi:MAG: choice-of-anchor B domain-containing protein [Rhodothermales bacterium]|jgi:choice-of-anchor B domain-containing protein
MNRVLSFVLVLAALFAVVPTTSAQYALQFGSSVAIAGDDVIVGEGRNLLLPGSSYVFSAGADGAYGLSATLSAGGDAADGFGRALAGDGNTVIVGAPQASRVYVFRKTDSGDWSQIAVLTSKEMGFGGHVAYSSGHLLVGAGGGKGETGSAHAFRSDDGYSWVPSGTFAASEPAPDDGYGTALSVSGTRAAIGAPGVNERAGMVQTLQFDGATGMWTDFGIVTHPAPLEGDGFGSSVLVAFDYLGIGAPGRDALTGSALSFKRAAEDAEWALNSKMAPFDSRSGEGFGSALAFGGNQVLVGAPGVGAREGGLYRFTPDPETGRMVTTEIEQPEAVHFRSGMGGALAAAGNLAVAGANGQDNFEGVAYIYLATEAGWSSPQMVFHDSGKFDSVVGAASECEDDKAGGFACSEVDMMSFLTRGDVGAGRGIQMNDVWGWEDPETGGEYAIIGRTDGTSFVNLSDPYNPVYLGNLAKTATANQSLWRDMKVYKDHAFIVADGAGAHHMQIFDLRQLRDVTDAPVEFEETAIYKGVFSSHNIVINEESGFAYAVGSDSGGESCGGALHMIDVRDPANPVFAGCFADRRTGRGGSGTTHDAQCVSYHGPDPDYSGREVCLSSNGTALSIADVTDKSNPTAISMAVYPNVAYAHQGWFDEEHRYFYLNDEGDEASGLVDATRTLIFDLTDLDDPVLSDEYFAEDNAIDHNLYIKDNLMYQTNYQAGLRIIDITNREAPVEVGFFDTVPYGKNDSSPVLGAWSSYPYFKSGVIVVTSGREGVFFLKKKNIDT